MELEWRVGLVNKCEEDCINAYGKRRTHTQSFNAHSFIVSNTLQSAVYSSIHVGFLPSQSSTTVTEAAAAAETDGKNLLFG